MKDSDSDFKKLSDAIMNSKLPPPVHVPKISRRRYRLYIKEESKLSERGWYWNPIGTEEGTLERAEAWLKADFNIWKRLPTAEYQIIETIHWQITTAVVKQGTRNSPP